VSPSLPRMIFICVPADDQVVAHSRLTWPRGALETRRLPVIDKWTDEHLKQEIRSRKSGYPVLKAHACYVRLPQGRKNAEPSSGAANRRLLLVQVNGRTLPCDVIDLAHARMCYSVTASRVSSSG